MFRPETRGEKRARENPKVVDQQFGKKPEVQVINEGGGGCFDDFIKVVQYVVCCCGCCTSYDEYHDNS